MLGTVALLALVATPALSRAKPDTRSAQCLSNMRALITAWQMYATENGDKAVISLAGSAATQPGGACGWVSGWMDWTSSPDNTNVMFLIDPRYAKFARYLTEPRVYRCPSDHFVSPNEALLGWTGRSRSYSLNIYIGAGNAEQFSTDSIYRHITRVSQFLYPGPAEAWVFLQERAESINDPAFLAPRQTAWVDIPASLHYGSAPFAFADGHAEMHKWSLIDSGSPATGDIHWVSYATVRASNRSY